MVYTKQCILCFAYSILKTRHYKESQKLCWNLIKITLYSNLTFINLKKLLKTSQEPFWKLPKSFGPPQTLTSRPPRAELGTWYRSAPGSYTPTRPLLTGRQRRSNVPDTVTRELVTRSQSARPPRRARGPGAGCDACVPLPGSGTPAALRAQGRPVPPGKTPHLQVHCARHRSPRPGLRSQTPRSWDGCLQTFPNHPALSHRRTCFLAGTDSSLTAVPPGHVCT